MKLISELPEPYRYLAELRREQKPTYSNKEDELVFAFGWITVLENITFWCEVYDAEDESQLPPLKPRYRIKGNVITKMW